MEIYRYIRNRRRREAVLSFGEDIDYIYNGNN
jgi:hypothetical protein